MIVFAEGALVFTLYYNNILTLAWYMMYDGCQNTYHHYYQTAFCNTSYYSYVVHYLPSTRYSVKQLSFHFTTWADFSTDYKHAANQNIPFIKCIQLTNTECWLYPLFKIIHSDYSIQDERRYFSQTTLCYESHFTE